MAAAARRIGPGDWRVALDVLDDIDELTGRVTRADDCEKLRRLVGRARDRTREASSMLLDFETGNGIISLLDDFVADADTFADFMQSSPPALSVAQSEQRTKAVRRFWKEMRVSFHALHREIQRLDQQKYR